MTTKHQIGVGKLTGQSPLAPASLLCRALNVLIWKLGPPAGYPNESNAIATFIIAELADKNIIGIEWDANDQEFVARHNDLKLRHGAKNSDL